MDNQVTTGTIGYNYLLTRQDTIGAFYRFSAYHFSGQPDAYGNHSINIAYGRKLTGRLGVATLRRSFLHYLSRNHKWKYDDVRG